MAEVVKDTEFTVNDETETGIIQIADDVVSSIVGLACTEVDGVSKLTGGITRDIISKLGKNNLSNGIKVVYQEDNSVIVDVSVEVKFGFNIVEVSNYLDKFYMLDSGSWMNLILESVDKFEKIDSDTPISR